MRIVQISDLHLRHRLPGASGIEGRLSRAVPEKLDEAVSALRRDPPDLLALTGDIIDFPFDAWDDPAMLKKGRADLEAVRERIERVGCPWVAFAGNHEPAALVRDVFGTQEADRIVAGHRVLVFEDQEGEGHVPRRTGSERDRFERALRDKASPPQVHLQHFVVWPERNEGYPHTYADGEAMRKAICASGVVRAVLSGHYHPGVPPTRIDGTTFAVAPAFCEAPHRWLDIVLRPA